MSLDYCYCCYYYNIITCLCAVAVVWWIQMWLTDLLTRHSVNSSHLWVRNNMLIHAPSCVSAHNRVMNHHIHSSGLAAILAFSLSFCIQTPQANKILIQKYSLIHSVEIRSLSWCFWHMCSLPVVDTLLYKPTLRWLFASEWTETWISDCWVRTWVYKSWSCQCLSINSAL